MSYKVVESPSDIEVTLVVSGWLRCFLLIALFSAVAAIGILYWVLGAGLRTLCLALPLAIGVISATRILLEREYLLVDRESVTFQRRWLGRELALSRVALGHHRFESADDPSFFAAAITPSQRVTYDGLRIGRRSLTSESASSLVMRLNGFLDSVEANRSPGPSDQRR